MRKSNTFYPRGRCPALSPFGDALYLRVRCFGMNSYVSFPLHSNAHQYLSVSWCSFRRVARGDSERFHLTRNLTLHPEHTH